MSDAKRSRDRSRTLDSGGTRRRARLWGAGALLIVATFVAYSTTFHYPFVFDDAHDIVENYSIRQLFPLSRASRVFVGMSNGQKYLHGRPLVNLSFALNYATGQLNPFHFHITNFAIHVLAGLTLFGIARRTLEMPSLAKRYGAVAVPLALTMAGVWMLHPLQTQAVTYLTQRYESMMGLFYLLSLYSAIRSDSSRHPHWWEAAAVTACLVSMGSKEVAVSIPLVILLYDRAFMAGSFAEAWRRRRGLYVALAATWIVLGVHLMVSGGRSSWSGFKLRITPVDYAASQLGVILHYLRMSFWPYPQVFDYGWPVARTAAQILPGALVVGGLGAATVYALVRRPMWGVLGAWFFLILAPTSSIMPIVDLAYEHRMYLSLAAVVAAAVIGAYEGLKRLEARSAPTLWKKRLLYALPALAVVAALGAAAFCRNQVYQSEWSVWYDTVQKVPRNARAHCNLGFAYFMQGKTKEAIEHYERSLKMDVRYSNAHFVMGFVLDQQGMTEEAIHHYREAIKINPMSSDAYYNLGIILRRQGKNQEAIEHYQKAIHINPMHATAYYNLGNVYGEQGDVERAVACYRKALEIDPSYAEAQAVLDRALRAETKKADNDSPLLYNSPFLPR